LEFTVRKTGNKNDLCTILKGAGDRKRIFLLRRTGVAAENEKKEGRAVALKNTLDRRRERRDIFNTEPGRKGTCQGG